MTFYNVQNLYKIFPQNVGNAILDTLDFKIFLDVPQGSLYILCLSSQNSLKNALRTTWHQAQKQYTANNHTLRFCVHLKYASLYRRFQSFWSLFRSFFSLVSIAVWIYFNQLLDTGALELNYLLPFLASVSPLQGPFDLSKLTQMYKS